jgi:glucokinase
MDAFIAVDAGGTQIRTALFQAGTKETEPLKMQRTPTRSKPKAFDTLTAAIEDIWPQDLTIRGIGVVLPGLLDPVTGVISFAANIPDWENFPLKQKLEKHFDVPFAVGNDANMAALGEWKYGAGKGHRNLIYITISTGIGSGIICDGRLLTGQKGLAGELGHTTVIPENGPMCGCGKRGHLEAVSSGTGISRYVTDQLVKGRASLLEKDHPSAREIADAARQGDALSIEAFHRAGTYLGRSLADALHIFNPSILILGGGVTQSADLLFDAMHTAIEENVISADYTRDLVISCAALGDDAGLQGARGLAELSFPIF